MVHQSNTFRLYNPKEATNKMIMSTNQVLRLDFSASFRFIDFTVRFTPNFFKHKKIAKSYLKTTFINLAT